MESSPGARLALLLLGAFDAMVDEVVSELAERSHPGMSATLEFALRAIDEGAGDASALGRRLKVSKQAAAKSIISLEQLGYVERRADARDARRKQLHVTDRGYEMTAVGAEVFDRRRERLRLSIGTRQLDEVETALVELQRGSQSSISATDAAASPQ